MPSARLVIAFVRLEPERETRIPGLARKRAPQARGLLGGNEAKAGHRWQGEPMRVR